VQRLTQQFLLPAEARAQIISRMLNWSRRFSILLFLDSSGYHLPHGRYDWLFAIDAITVLKPGSEDFLAALYNWHQLNQDWLFGHIAYDFKNSLEPGLSSRHEPAAGWDDIFFYQPRIVCYQEHGSRYMTIACLDDQPAEIYAQIMMSPPVAVQEPHGVCFNPRVEKEKYLEIVRKLQRHIKDGDCYEINYCTEGYCRHASIDTVSIYLKLNKLSPAPFAAMYRNHLLSMVCASPERYLFRHGDRVLSQPIKGTAPRSRDEVEDAKNKLDLFHSEKNRAENVMIVDLVRNDLARCCEPGYVTVDELFGIYSFPQVHQMISTVSGKLKPGLPFTDAIRFSFPMGSMTGAPKYKVMQLIDHYESSGRELFSGSVGYIDPGGNFDLNVIIRSLFYNEATGYLNYMTGGAITADSIPEEEFEEMRLKAWALERIFAG